MPEARPAESLQRYLRAAFLSRGLAPEHAERVAEDLVATSLRGTDTHGIQLAPIYLRLLDAGRARAKPALQWSERAPSLAVLDADFALGHIAGAAAVARVTEMARTQGIGLVQVRRSNHFGAACCFTLPLAAAGLMGMACSNTDALVAPWNGTGPLQGTNPLALAAPGENGDVFSLDMATSQVSYSRVKRHQAEGTPLESGWAIGESGRFTLDPASVAALAPLGGYKGMGLALAVQVLTALLANATYDHELANVFTPTVEGNLDVTHLIGAIDIARFTDLAAFRARLSGLLRAIRTAPAIPTTAVLAPGDPEATARRDRVQRGIPITPEWTREMAELFVPLAP